MVRSKSNVSDRSNNKGSRLIGENKKVKDKTIDANHVLRQSILAKILSKLTSNHYITIY